MLNHHSSFDGRIVLINIELDENVYTVVNIYAPNNEVGRAEFFRKLIKWISQYSDNTNNLIIMGDFNCCLNNTDRTPQTHLKDKSRNTLSKLIQTLNLLDGWEQKHKDQTGFTYVDVPNNTKSRLDYILYSKTLMFNLENVELSKPIKGDHLALASTFNQTVNKRGAGYWKFNSSLLDDINYCTFIEGKIDQLILDSNDIDSKRLVWEYIKVIIKKYTI